MMRGKTKKKFFSKVGLINLIKINRNMEKMGEWKPIGKVVHYFDKIGVAVIKLKSPLAKGAAIRIVGGEDTDFHQEVASMEIDHEKIEKADKGQEVGLKVKEKVREGYEVYCE